MLDYSISSEDLVIEDNQNLRNSISWNCHCLEQISISVVSPFRDRNLSCSQNDGLWKIFTHEWNSRCCKSKCVRSMNDHKRVIIIIVVFYHFGNLLNLFWSKKSWINQSFELKEGESNSDAPADTSLGRPIPRQFSIRSWLLSSCEIMVVKVIVFQYFLSE